MLLTVAGYVADVAVLAAYAAGLGRRFDWANALGCIPLVAIGVQLHSYPTVVLSAAFGVIGWTHILRDRP